jgi:hypothetical protein
MKNVLSFVFLYVKREELKLIKKGNADENSFLMFEN